RLVQQRVDPDFELAQRRGDLIIELVRVVAVDYDDGVKACRAEQPEQPGVDALGDDHREARVNPQRVDRGRLELRDELAEPAVRQAERVAAAQNRLADAGPRAQRVDGR